MRREGLLSDEDLVSLSEQTQEFIRMVDEA
jgi:hypothetical protein